MKMKMNMVLAIFGVIYRPWYSGLRPSMSIAVMLPFSIVEPPPLPLERTTGMSNATINDDLDIFIKSAR